MNFSATTYIKDGLIINKIYIDHGWVMTYDKLKNKIKVNPIEIFNSTLETRNKFCIKNTKEELISVINELELFNETVVDKAIKNIFNYTSID